MFNKLLIYSSRLGGLYFGAQVVKYRTYRFLKEDGYIQDMRAHIEIRLEAMTDSPYITEEFWDDAARF